MDVVAPGQSVVSLRVPNSQLDAAYPGARTGERFFRGTGTSQSAAVVSGAAALLLEQRPELTPDQVKALLMGSARPLPAADAAAQGAGLIDVAAAICHGHADRGPDLGALDGYRFAGEGARYATRQARRNQELRGEVDFTGREWNARPVREGAAALAAQSGTPWPACPGTGLSWYGLSWNGLSWSGLSWNGLSWSGLTWNGLSWNGLVLERTVLVRPELERAVLVRPELDRADLERPQLAARLTA